MKSFLFLTFILSSLSLSLAKYVGTTTAQSSQIDLKTALLASGDKTTQKHITSQQGLTPTSQKTQKNKESATPRIPAIQWVRNEYIMLRKLPHTEKDLIKTFNERPEREVKTIANHHNQNAEQVVKLIFPGASIDFYQNNHADEKSIALKNAPMASSMTLLQMHLEKNKPRLKDLLPIQVGHTRTDVEQKFEVDTGGQDAFEMCELQEMTIAGPVYSSACVEFNFQEDKITQIDWVLPLD